MTRWHQYTWLVLSTGVRKSKDGRWEASIYADGGTQYLGFFDDEEAAARIYDEKAKQVFDNPILNFLPDGSLNPDREPTYVESRSKRLMFRSRSLCDHFWHNPTRQPLLVKAPRRPSTYRGLRWDNGRVRVEIV